METTPQPTRPTWEHRLQAVLALLGGEPVPDVMARFGMGRSILYTWRHRALTALQGALTDHRPGPQCPANRLCRRGRQPIGGALWPRAVIRQGTLEGRECAVAPFIYNEPVKG